MALSGKRRYLVLDDPLPSSEIPNILGILVRDVANPLDRSAPVVTEAIAARLKDFTLEPVVRVNATDVLQQAGSSSLVVALQKVFKLAASHEQQTQLDIKTARIRTVRLKGHDKAFEWMKKNCAAEIRDFLAQWKHHTLYMVVGFKTIVDANIRIAHAASRTVKVEGEVPVAQAAGMAAGVVPPVSGNTGNASVSATAGSCEEILYEATHEGEQIFAVQYRKINRGFILRRLFSSGSILAEPGELVSFGKGRALGGDKSESESESESLSDEESDDDLAMEFPTAGLSAIREGHASFGISQTGEVEEFLYRCA
ncbi:hypothetical protein B0H67DRAFT_591498 [Lasiosphaeris hirsuta]|uniref:Uncharacterized protein n=1 Tax=Lasiosphaeris hirsuta TaxID=260670 RepID=A0AA40DII8_9PEZI|nr:hypothetical protein B0H67DRAFT_591498 [Lasiosphaeris hirsuta]